MLCVLEASAQKGIARKLQSCVVNAVCSDIFIQEGETGSQQTKELQTNKERKREKERGMKEKSYKRDVSSSVSRAKCCLSKVKWGLNLKVRLFRTINAEVIELSLFAGCADMEYHVQHSS